MNTGIGTSADERLTPSDSETKPSTAPVTTTTLPTNTTTENNYVNISDALPVGQNHSTAITMMEQKEELSKKGEKSPANIYEERVDFWGRWLNNSSIAFIV